jgi:hypothetical protein
MYSIPKIFDPALGPQVGKLRDGSLSTLGNHFAAQRGLDIKPGQHSLDIDKPTQFGLDIEPVFAAGTDPADRFHRVDSDELPPWGYVYGLVTKVRPEKDRVLVWVRSEQTVVVVSVRGEAVMADARRSLRPLLSAASFIVYLRPHPLDPERFVEIVADTPFTAYEPTRDLHTDSAADRPSSVVFPAVINVVEMTPHDFFHDQVRFSYPMVDSRRPDAIERVSGVAPIIASKHYPVVQCAGESCYKLKADHVAAVTLLAESRKPLAQIREPLPEDCYELSVVDIQDVQPNLPLRWADPADGSST